MEFESLRVRNPSPNINILKMKSSKKRSYKNWRYYLLELFVVFIGVMGAFLLNTWRENRISTSLSENYLESIRADLQEDHETLKENINLLQDKILLLSRFLYNKGDDWTMDSTNLALGNAMSIVTFSGKSSTYESMKYSGHLNLIRDFNTRTAIVSYYESFSKAAIVDELTKQWVTVKLVDLFLEEMDMRTGAFLDDSIFNELSFWNRFNGLLVLLNQNSTAYNELLGKNQLVLEMLED
jgi:hypothetical protein